MATEQREGGNLASKHRVYCSVTVVLGGQGRYDVAASVARGDHDATRQSQSYLNSNVVRK